MCAKIESYLVGIPDEFDFPDVKAGMTIGYFFRLRAGFRLHLHTVNRAAKKSVLLARVNVSLL
jgi:hypothetical protein